jgi:uncharacterized membrane protein HdeD (DUF308 family)
MSTPDSAVAAPLRRLYFIRFAFAIVWAVLVTLTAKSFGPVVVTLAVIYPLFDVAAAIVDSRSSRATRSALGLYVNIGISLLAAVGIGIAATAGAPGILRVWGIWAIVAGLIQLVVAIVRRSLGGQWPMILSGGISVLAGAGFFLMASQPGASLTSVGGYAVLGGIFFLISALRLGRTVKAAQLSAGTV